MANERKWKNTKRDWKRKGEKNKNYRKKMRLK